MSQHTYPGGPVMVKIDGSTIRTIRESKGLTQLYVATAVEVTTDTVSRWENRRYPSIKKENAVKLAEALEVPLDDILDIGERGHEAEADRAEPEYAPLGDGVETAKHGTPRRIAVLPPKRLQLVFGVAAAVLIGVVAYVLFFGKQVPQPPVTIRRIVSPHFIPGQPVPIFIAIDAAVSPEISFILKEILPPGSRFVMSSPEISGMDRKDHSIKWLGKISGTARYLYVIKSDPSFQGHLSFSGSLKMVSSDASPLPVTGDAIATAGLHHWADLNRDNRISDEEILRAYDLGLTDNSLGIDMDLIEEMWLGDGYVWHPDQQRFSIVE